MYLFDFLCDSLQIDYVQYSIIISRRLGRVVRPGNLCVSWVRGRVARDLEFYYPSGSCPACPCCCLSLLLGCCLEKLVCETMEHPWCFLHGSCWVLISFLSFSEGLWGISLHPLVPQDCRCNVHACFVLTVLCGGFKEDQSEIAVKSKRTDVRSKRILH